MCIQLMQEEILGKLNWCVANFGPKKGDQEFVKVRICLNNNFEDSYLGENKIKRPKTMYNGYTEQLVHYWKKDLMSF
jgi:hypothetical protein